MEWVLAEHAERIRSRRALKTKKDEAGALLAWLRAAHPGQPRYPTSSTIANRIAAAHRAAFLLN
jgi:hypothetical protein